jgi:hypothetical protein
MSDEAVAVSPLRDPPAWRLVRRAIRDPRARTAQAGASRAHRIISTGSEWAVAARRPAPLGGQGPTPGERAHAGAGQACAGHIIARRQAAPRIMFISDIASSAFTSRCAVAADWGMPVGERERSGAQHGAQTKVVINRLRRGVRVQSRTDT